MNPHAGAGIGLLSSGDRRQFQLLDKNHVKNRPQLCQLSVTKPMEKGFVLRNRADPLMVNPQAAKTMRPRKNWFIRRRRPSAAPALLFPFRQWTLS